MRYLPNMHILRKNINTQRNSPAVKVQRAKGGEYSMASMYCVKCRAKRDDPDAQPVTMKNGKPAMKGKCPVCGTGMYKIGSK